MRLIFASPPPLENNIFPRNPQIKEQVYRGRGAGGLKKILDFSSIIERFGVQKNIHPLAMTRTIPFFFYRKCVLHEGLFFSCRRRGGGSGLHGQWAFRSVNDSVETTHLLVLLFGESPLNGRREHRHQTSRWLISRRFIIFL